VSSSAAGAKSQIVRIQAASWVPSCATVELAPSAPPSRHTAAAAAAGDISTVIMPETPTGAGACSVQSFVAGRSTQSRAPNRVVDFLLILAAMATAEIRQAVFLVFLHAALSLLALRAEGKTNRLRHRFVLLYITCGAFRISGREIGHPSLPEFKLSNFILHTMYAPRA